MHYKCIKWGHDWIDDPYYRECLRCGRNVPTQFAKNKEYEKLKIAPMSISVPTYRFLRQFFRRMPKYFYECVTPLENVANALYFLRYKEGWDVEEIERKTHMRPQKINALILRYPVTERDYRNFLRKWKSEQTLVKHGQP